MLNLTKENYKKLISDVEREFSLILAKSEESESENKEEEKKEESVDHEVKDAITGESEPSTENKEEQDKEVAAEDKKEEKDAEKDSEEQAAHGYDEGDMEELHKIYASMPKAELELHKGILEKNWMAKCGQITSGEAPMAKSEVIKEESLLKSENESLKEENSNLKKSVEDLVAAMNKFVSGKAPERKAITEIGFVKKSEESNPTKQLTKSEIDMILTKKTQDASLSKSDRDAINNYYAQGKRSVEVIKHLLA